MTATSKQDILAEIWAIKDSLSASKGYDLKVTCQALYAEQQKHPQDFINLGIAPAHELEEGKNVRVLKPFEKE